jgi:hypothetical protein
MVCYEEFQSRFNQSCVLSPYCRLAVDVDCDDGHVVVMMVVGTITNVRIPPCLSVVGYSWLSWCAAPQNSFMLA